MLTPASMLLLPSKGSNTTQYFPLSLPSIKIACSNSSETSTAVFPDARSALTIISFDNTSSFFCSSPVAFLSPAKPTLARISKHDNPAIKNVQIYKTSLSHVGCYELGGHLDSIEEQCEISCDCWAETELFSKNLS